MAAASNGTPKPYGEDFGKACGVKSKGIVVKNWDFLRGSEAFAVLGRGDAFYCFKMAVGKELSPLERKMIAQLINLTSFPNELRDNIVEPLDMSDPETLEKHTFMLNKASYFLPGLKTSDVSPELISSLEYQRASQPGKPKIWDDVEDPNTFRLTKTIITAIYSITVQLKASCVPAEKLKGLELLTEGLRVDKAILLERTKRDKTHKDSTKKVKSVLLYHQSSHGLLVTNVTTVANTSIPSVVASIVTSSASSGADEVAETAEKTRAYFQKLQTDRR